MIATSYLDNLEDSIALDRRVLTLQPSGHHNRPALANVYKHSGLGKIRVQLVRYIPFWPRMLFGDIGSMVLDSSTETGRGN
jgi:hypothetical protein